MFCFLASEKLIKHQENLVAALGKFLTFPNWEVNLKHNNNNYYTQ